MQRTFPGLADDWGLVTSEAVLDVMHEDLGLSRHATRLNPHDEWNLVKDLSIDFVEEKEVTELRRRVPG